MSDKTRFIKFSIIGLINTAVDFSIFLLLFRLLHIDPLVANGASYLVAVTNSYALNRAWTFNVGLKTYFSWSSYGRFLMVNSVGLLIGMAVIYLLSSEMAAELAKIMSIFITLVWNFFGTKYFVFNGRQEGVC